MRVYLGLGTNLGDKESNLHVAVRKINERIGEVTALSAFYVTAPWGFSSENSFLNAACCVESVLPPLDILRETQEIERELGRMKKSAGGNYSDRLIDIDILLYGDLILPFFILIFLPCIKMNHYGFSRKSIWKNLETFP